MLGALAAPSVAWPMGGGDLSTHYIQLYVQTIAVIASMVGNWGCAVYFCRGVCFSNPIHLCATKLNNAYLQPSAPVTDATFLFCGRNVALVDGRNAKNPFLNFRVVCLGVGIILGSSSTF